MSMRSKATLAVLALALAGGSRAQARPLKASDYLKLRSVGSVAFSPDSRRIAYTIESNDAPGRPYRQLWVLSVADGRAARIGGDGDRGGEPFWSPDGQWIAFKGKLSGKDGLHVVRPDGGDARFLASVTGTNSPLTFEGRSIAWSPDSKRIAYVSATPGPETEAAGSDPVVITRYLYKPDADEGDTRFNDNRRRHIFLVDVTGGEPRALTSGLFEEHSIDWSPAGGEILCVSNREADPDFFYNPDLFAVRVSDGGLRRLTATESAEYQPRWSPDGNRIVFLGTRRGLTDLETTMEDTHVWVMDKDGSKRREVGASIDNRQASAVWSPDGASVDLTVQERGNVRLYRLPTDGARPEAVVSDVGRVTSFAYSRSGVLAYAFSGPSDLPQLFLQDRSAWASKAVATGASSVAG